VNTRAVNAPARPISAIAKDIIVHWGSALETDGYAALPCLQALQHVDHISEAYQDTDAEILVRRFLSNAYMFKGEQARLLKEELRAHLPRRVKN